MPPQNVDAVTTVVMPPGSARAPLAERMMAMSSQVILRAVHASVSPHVACSINARSARPASLAAVHACKFAQTQPDVSLQAAPAAVQEPLINGNASAGIAETPAADVATVMPLQEARSPDATTIPAEVSDIAQPSVGHMHTCIGTCTLHRVAPKRNMRCSPLLDRVSQLYWTLFGGCHSSQGSQGHRHSGKHSCRSSGAARKDCLVVSTADGSRKHVR